MAEPPPLKPPRVVPETGPPGVPPPLDPQPRVAPETGPPGVPPPPDQEQPAGTAPVPTGAPFPGFPAGPGAPTDEGGGRRIHYGARPRSKVFTGIVVAAVMVGLLIYYQAPLVSLGTLAFLLVLAVSLASNTFVERRNPAEAIFTSGFVLFQRLVVFPLDDRTLLDVVLIGDICELHVRRDDGLDRRLLAGNRSAPVVSFAVRAGAALGIRVRIDPALGPADRG